MSEPEGETLPAVPEEVHTPSVPHSGQWKPGQSGNPKGRPKGSKNHLITLQRELEIAVREHIKPEKVKKILDKLLELAEGGNMKAIKLLLDKIISNASSSDETPEDHGKRVVFLIENATFAARPESAPVQPASTQPVLDAEFVESSPTSTLQDHDGH